MIRQSVTPHQQIRGFTLLEVLLALTIFAMLSFAAYQVLQAVQTNDDVSKTKIARLSEIQRAITIMSRDMAQVVPRTSRVSSENSDLIFQASQGLSDSNDWGVEFVRAGWLNPGAQLRRSELAKTVYRLVDGQLQRLVYLYPDQYSNAEPEISVLLTGVTAFTLRFYKDHDWHTSWDTPKKLPEGIEVTIHLTDYGTIERVIPFAGAEPSKKAKDSTDVTIDDVTIDDPKFSGDEDSK